MRRFLRAPDVVFGIGPWIPAVIPLLAVGVVGAGLSLLLLPAGWAWVGVVAAGVAVVRVRTRARAGICSCWSPGSTCWWP